MLRSVGFFHFGDRDKSAPIRSLVQALEKKAQSGESLRDALIVLPEAFNLGVDYNQGKTDQANYDPSVKNCLMRLAGEFEVMFVAGLIIWDSSEQVLPFSSAYFIDKINCKLLSRKWSKDQAEGLGHLYVSSRGWPPMAYDVAPAVTVGALICFDAKLETRGSHHASENNKDLHALLESRMKHAARKIVCVPANWKSGDDIEDACSWKGYDWIVANSNGSPLSFIKLAGSTTCSVKNDTIANAIEILPYNSTETR